MAPEARAFRVENMKQVTPGAKAFRVKKVNPVTPETKVLRVKSVTLEARAFRYSGYSG